MKFVEIEFFQAEDKSFVRSTYFLNISVYYVMLRLPNKSSHFASFYFFAIIKKWLLYIFFPYLGTSCSR
jgi:hypothetical protein